jgi:multidrug efflux pump subunit AcrA (membrane-fusion protein)
MSVDVNRVRESIRTHMDVDESECALMQKSLLTDIRRQQDIDRAKLAQLELDKQIASMQAERQAKLDVLNRALESDDDALARVAATQPLLQDG